MNYEKQNYGLILIKYCTDHMERKVPKYENHKIKYILKIRKYFVKYCRDILESKIYAIHQYEIHFYTPN